MQRRLDAIDRLGVRLAVATAVVVATLSALGRSFPSDSLFPIIGVAILGVASWIIVGRLIGPEGNSEVASPRPPGLLPGILAVAFGAACMLGFLVMFVGAWAGVKGCEDECHRFAVLMVAAAVVGLIGFASWVAGVMLIARDASSEVPLPGTPELLPAILAVAFGAACVVAFLVVVRVSWAGVQGCEDECYRFAAYVGAAGVVGISGSPPLVAGLGGLANRPVGNGARLASWLLLGVAVSLVLGASLVALDAVSDGASTDALRLLSFGVPGGAGIVSFAIIRSLLARSRLATTGRP